ncbi:DUF6630 family protein [Carnobacterium gallinarum]|uniref:DUF6630 family protein n=1 Tax=Carnobacterium gallinarum TaxID=2749 RepID=UPI0005553C7C|nr:hypothetical protein [Carnobacterium gallinarum]
MKGVLSFIILLLVAIVILVNLQKKNRVDQILIEPNLVEDVTKEEYETVVLEIANLLSMNNQGLEEKLLYCINDYSGYFVRYQDELALRGIENPDKISFKLVLWLGMIDGLQQLDLVSSHDWKDNLDGFLAGILFTSKKQNSPLSVIVKPSGSEEIFAPEAFALIVNQLPTLYHLVNLDSDGDEYNLIVVEETVLVKLQKLAKQINVKIVDLK